MQDLLKTVSKYPAFLLGAIVGVFLFALQPLMPLLKRPVTAVPLIVGFLAGLAFIGFTLRAMLGLGSI